MRAFFATVLVCAASLVPLSSAPLSPAANTAPYPGLTMDVDLAMDGSMTLFGKAFGIPLPGNGTYQTGEMATIDLVNGLVLIQVTPTGVLPGNQQVGFHYDISMPIVGVFHVGDYFAPIGSWRLAYTPLIASPGDNSLIPENRRAQDAVFLLAITSNHVGYGTRVQTGTSCDVPVHMGSMSPNHPATGFSTSCYGDFAADVVSWGSVPVLHLSSVGGPYPFDTVSPLPAGTYYIRYNQ